MELTIKEARDELAHVIGIEKALLNMLTRNGEDYEEYTEDDLNLLTSKIVEAAGYIVQIKKLIADYERRLKKGDYDE
jgi:hypothetical protein